MKKSIVALFLISICIMGYTSFYGFEEKNKPIILNDILQLQQTEINSFDPIDAYHAGHIQIVKQLYNTLTDIDLEGDLVPSLATSWETLDGMTWTFHLRDDVLFAENDCFKEESERLFNADDVKYSFERLLNKESKSLGISYFKNIVGFDNFRAGESTDLYGLKIKDRNTIIFQLKDIDYNFPNLLTLPFTGIVKKQAVNFYGEKFRVHPVGSGPFILTLYEANKKITLTKNPFYWEKQFGKHLPLINGVTINLTTDDNLSFLLFKNQKSNFLELSLPLLHQAENTKFSFEYDKEVLEWTQLHFYLFNLERIQNKKIRQGINFAIDRNELQRILSEQGKVASTLFPTIFNKLAVQNSMLKSSPEKAKTLLQEKIKLSIVCFEDILSRAVAENLSQQLSAYGIDTNVEAVTFPVLVDRLTKGDYDMIQLYWGPLYADIRHYLNPFLTASFPPAGNNFNKYSNPTFDKLVETAPHYPSHKQIAQYLEAQDVILSDMPFFLGYFKNMIRVSNKEFSLPMHPLGYRFYKYAQQN